MSERKYIPTIECITGIRYCTRPNLLSIGHNQSRQSTTQMRYHLSISHKKSAHTVANPYKAEYSVTSSTNQCYMLKSQNHLQHAGGGQHESAPLHIGNSLRILYGMRIGEGLSGVSPCVKRPLHRASCKDRSEFV